MCWRWCETWGVITQCAFALFFIFDLGFFLLIFHRKHIQKAIRDTFRDFLPVYFLFVLRRRVHRFNEIHLLILVDRLLGMEFGICCDVCGFKRLRRKSCLHIFRIRLFDKSVLVSEESWTFASVSLEDSFYPLTWFFKLGDDLCEVIMFS